MQIHHDDEIEREIEVLADLTSRVLTLVGEAPKGAGKSALSCALALLVAAEAEHDDERAADLLRAELFPDIIQLVGEECAAPYQPCESVYLN